jgi:hypothetical protein
MPVTKGIASKHQTKLTETLFSTAFPVLRVESGTYWQTPFVITGWGNVTDLATGYMRGIPVIIPKRVKLDRIGMNIIGAGSAGAKVRLGIYLDDGNGYPSTLISGTDVDELDAATAGWKENTIDVTLDPGLYWLVFAHNDGTVDFRRLTGSVIIGFYTSTQDNLIGHWRATFAYAALPFAFPSGASAQNEYWQVRVRISEVLS